MMRTLHPGDVACAERGERLETLLGSCVAIVLTDPRRTVGAMCHVVHAGLPVAGATATTAYGPIALAALYELLQARGITPRLCEAWVFGGGNMFADRIEGAHVGEQNVRWALDALALDGVRVIAQDIGGRTYRRLGWTIGPDAPDVTAVRI